MRIVMTGATGGIGAQAAKTLLAKQDVELLVGARGAPSLPGAHVEALDLADLISVRAFAEKVVRAGPIDALICNAGLQMAHYAISAQGFELTFATNHLAHYLLVRLLLPSLAPGARVILTSSGTHDPEQRTGMPPPRHADARLLAHPENEAEPDTSPGGAGRRAYSASKLCNLMTARELARRTADRPEFTTLAFDPGFVPGTGLARDYGTALNAVFRHVLPLVIHGAGVSRATASGRALAALATEPQYAGGRGAYWSMHRRIPTVKQPSVLALDDAACARLWDDSAALVGLEP